MIKSRWLVWGLTGWMLLSAAAVRAEPSNCGESVPTASGPVQGMAAPTPGVCSWLGIPYAAPPVGERRWKKPAPPASWTAPLMADHFSAVCAQRSSLLDLDLAKIGKPAGSEDCLYLNIWRPQKSGVFPVMFWIHGGTLLTGSAATPMYWGDRIAANQDVVVVSINYRLGPFGFLALEDLRREDPDGAVGGYGHLDQIFALKWVQQNIAAFGGDPHQVTIFGESAGGWSVCTLTATPLAKGLFQRAIQESGGCRRSRTLEQGFAYGREFAKALGCANADAACLRKKTPAELLKAAVWDETGQKSPFMPHEDGYLLAKSPLQYLRDGDYNRVPYLAGSNRDETRPLILIQPRQQHLTAKRYEREIREQYGQLADALLQAYPAAAFPSPTEAYIARESDRILSCGGHDAVDAIAQHQAEVWYYRFDYDEQMLGKKIGAFHGLELPFVFGNFDRKPIALLFGKKRLPAAEPLSLIIQSYWANFAKTGNPNGPGLPEWPAYDSTNRSRILFDVPEISASPASFTAKITVIREPDELFRRCEFWDQYWSQTGMGGN